MRLQQLANRRTRVARADAAPVLPKSQGKGSRWQERQVRRRQRQRQESSMLCVSEGEVRQGERLQVKARAHQEQFSSSNVKRQGASQVEGCRQGRSASYCKEGHLDARDSPEAIGSCGKGKLQEGR